MEQSSFSILKAKYPELYHVAIEAENYAHSDHSAFLLKIRMFLEIWSHEFAYQKTTQVVIEPKLFDKIEQLKSSEIITAPIYSLLHEIRTICNKGVHLIHDWKRGFCQVLEISDNEINQCLSAIFRLSALLIGEQNLTCRDGLQISEEAKLASAVTHGFFGEGKASLTAAKLIHTDIKASKKKSQFSEYDLVYWLNKALEQQHFEAIEFYSQLVTENRYKSITLTKLKAWLEQFKDLKNNSSFALIAAKTYEKLGEMPTALKNYQIAAEQGCFHSIKRLQDYWIKRDEEQFFIFVTLGSKFNERRSVYYFLIFQILEIRKIEKADARYPQKLKDLKQQYLKAKSFCVEGLAHAEIVLSMFNLLDFSKSIDEVMIGMEKSWVSAPRCFTLDYAIFVELLNKNRFEPFMVSMAQVIMPLCTDEKRLAELEYDLALLQAQLTKERKAFLLKQNTRELLKSAARKGHKDAVSLLNQLSGRFNKRVVISNPARASN
ncbi:MAG: DUF4145 domain-containing protein [Alishewanella aestuarii]